MIDTLAEPTIVAAQQLVGPNGRTRRFEGVQHQAAVSYFFVENDPGQGARLHWHPYPETWVVLEGEATFVVADRSIVAAAGDTVTGPAFVPHKFTNTGHGRMRLIGIHASAVIIQTDVE